MACGGSWPAAETAAGCAVTAARSAFETRAAAARVGRVVVAFVGGRPAGQ